MFHDRMHTWMWKKRKMEKQVLMKYVKLCVCVCGMVVCVVHDSVNRLHICSQYHLLGHQNQNQKKMKMTTEKMCVVRPLPSDGVAVSLW